MVEINLKSLIARLDRFCTRSLEAAAGVCVSRTNYEVTPEHFLLALSEDPTADVQQIYKHFGVDPGRVQKSLSGIVETLKTGNAGRPTFSPLLVEWFQQAWLLGSLEFGLAEIRSGILFQVLLANPVRLGADEWVSLFESINRLDLKAKFATIISASTEQSRRMGSGTAESSGAPSSSGGIAAGGGETALAKYANNFTAQARENKIDPVFGRDREIRQMIDILARRRKNNPICVGEPGVGKTAVVEGLALKIVEGDVPDALKNVELMGLDMGLLQAGASVKGEFENRLKGVIEEVKSSPKPIILFIDEAHTLIGAGGQAGGGDAANLLKPALARGELRTIAATTWSEYKKYFEKDAALARRFQLVKLDEPDEETTVTMLRGLRDRYEKAHNVVIRDEALQAAAQLGSRYIAGRQHPDKGVDLMDTSAARVKIALTTKPPELQDLERRIQTLEREQSALKRDKAGGAKNLDERLSEVEKEISATKDKIAKTTDRWQKEKAAVEKVLEVRKKLDGPDAKKEADKLSRELESAQSALKEIQGKDPIIFADVTPEVVARVVADWTGIPIGKMVQDQAAALLSFEDSLHKRIKGQDHVSAIVGKGIRAAKAGLKNPRTPMGVFLFVGPSGVGKTETALGVADLLFGGERFLTVINMSEFQEKHTVSRLIGSPPGYVGYGEGGVLTEAVRQKPYSVVLLDECEKADPEVLNLFYQVFDKGMLSDGEGREVDFKDTVLFLTSNLATDLIMQSVADGSKPPIDDLVALIRPALSKHFKPALLARMTIVPFYPIGQDALKEITRLKLGQLEKRLRENHRMSMDIDPKVIDAIAERCTEVETGARNVDHIISGTLLPKISSEILQQMSTGSMPDRIAVKLNDQGDFAFEFSRK
ncbi:MAG TPA: type VI secretion system ATPase TssH [Planctomycetota bacterium]|nr:type VI secretion system ATPase TssH [Planctomycetota bacterium]